jgi:hypothetical protein
LSDPSDRGPREVAAQAKRRRPSFLFRLTALLLVLVVSLLVIEGAFRGWLLIRGAAQSKTAIREEAVLLLSRVTDTLPVVDAGQIHAEERARHRDPLVAHPFAGFTQESSATVAKIGHGDDSPHRPFRILLLGGSVAAGFGNTGSREMVKILERTKALEGRKVELDIQACPGHKQPQQLGILAYSLALGQRPDLVIELDGHNEVAIGLTNRRGLAFPPYPSASHWSLVASHSGEFPGAVHMRALREQAIELESRIETDLGFSAVRNQLLLAQARKLVVRYASLADEYAAWLASGEASASLRGPTWSGNDQQTLDLVVSVWKEASISMAAMCRARSIRYVHALQPSLHDEGSKPATEEELRLGATSEAWLTGVRSGYPRLREAGAALAAQGIAFVDLSRTFENEAATVYIDACHFNLKGYDRLGVRLGESIAALLDG